MQKSDTVQIYTPLLKFMRAKDVTRKMQFGPVDTDFFWYKQPHFLEYQKSIKVTLYCSLDFTSFPFDYHYCDLRYGSASSAPKRLLLEPPYIREHTL